MNIAVKVSAADAAAEIAATPLDKLNPARIDRFYNDTIWPVFERLRREDPVHFTPDSEYGPYWSITKWNDIMAVDTNHQDFSSADGITLFNLEMVAEQERVMGPRRRGDAAPGRLLSAPLPARAWPRGWPGRCLRPTRTPRGWCPRP